MNRHASPSGKMTHPPIPEPTYAERARTLVYLGRNGSLATVSEKHPGHPFVSVMPYALDSMGFPLFLISTMAMHTQNLLKDPRASLLVTQPGWEKDLLAGGRVTIMGSVAKLQAPDDLEEARDAYLSRHANAASWVDFEDFAFYRLIVSDVYFVGGFAAMDWIPADAYLGASPDPLADVAPGIIEHMNRDHADALLLLARVSGGEETDEATMTSVDRLGFRLRLKSKGRLHGIRIAFAREVRSADEVRAAFIEMLNAARTA